jgi:signal transduction histidine kinase
MKSISWAKIAITVLAAGSTYYLRSLLGLAGLQALTYLLPVAFASYLFGSVMGMLAYVMTLGVIHVIWWLEAPQVLLSRQYFVGIFNYTLFSGLVVLYSYRHERVLRRLDQSLEREKQARQEAEKANRLKDQFLATLSHELRTPINVILGYLQILLSERTQNPRRALEIVHRNAQQQARLIEDVLDVSRMTNGTFQIELTEVLAVRVLREAIESLQPAIVEKKLRLELGAAVDEVVIMADPDRLRQVFWNILSNAIKFTPAGGRIDVRAAQVGTELEISVRDTGRGIPDEFLPYVFDMFRQADPSPTREVSGMGLGLNLVKRFVEMQGGTVAADSRGVGHGATFICRFPVRVARFAAPGSNRPRVDVAALIEDERKRWP